MDLTVDKSSSVVGPAVGQGKAEETTDALSNSSSSDYDEDDSQSICSQEGKGTSILNYDYYLSVSSVGQRETKKSIVKRDI